MTKIVHFYENGLIKESGWEDNYGKQGQWIFYSQNGYLFREATFKDDLVHGESITYNEDGTNYYSILFVNGIRHGKGFETYDHGQIREEFIYDNGNYRPVNFWDEQGNQLMQDGSGKKNEYLGPGGHLKVEQYFENGEFIKEVKLTEVSYGSFIPDQDTPTSSPPK